MTDKQPPKRKPAKPAPPAKKQPASKQPAARKTAARKGTPAKKTAPAKKAAPKKATQASKAQDTAKATQSVTDLVGEAKRAVGRPAKYTDDFIPQMIAYFDIETERIEEEPLRDKEGNAVIVDGKPVMRKIPVVNKFPTLERFAARIGVTRETLHDWATAKNEDGTLVHPEFSYTYARAKTIQTALLTEGGLAGLYESRVVNFALKNISGWKEQVEQTIVADVTTTASDKLDALYEAGIRKAAEEKRAALQRKLEGIVPGQGGQIGPDSE